MVELDKRVAPVMQTYQQRLLSKPYVPSSTFERSSLGADGVANK